MTSSSISSVLHAAHTGRHEETKSGAYIYKGDAASYHEWEFRTLLRTHNKRGDAYIDAVSKIVDGLHGDAFTVAREIGLANLWIPGVEGWEEEDDEEPPNITTHPPVPSGIEKLVAAMKETIFPLSSFEAKELFRQYCKQSGALSRQSGESLSLIHI